MPCIVFVGVMVKLAEYYSNFITNGSLLTQFSIPSEHAMVGGHMTVTWQSHDTRMISADHWWLWKQMWRPLHTLYQQLQLLSLLPPPPTHLRWHQTRQQQYSKGGEREHLLPVHLNLHNLNLHTLFICSYWSLTSLSFFWTPLQSSVWTLLALSTSPQPAVINTQV